MRTTNVHPTVQQRDSSPPRYVVSTLQNPKWLRIYHSAASTHQNLSRLPPTPHHDASRSQSSHWQSQPNVFCRLFDDSTQHLTVSLPLPNLEYHGRRRFVPIEAIPRCQIFTQGPLPLCWIFTDNTLRDPYKEAVGTLALSLFLSLCTHRLFFSFFLRYLR